MNNEHVTFIKELPVYILNKHYLKIKRNLVCGLIQDIHCVELYVAL